ncbi:MAG: D-glycero-beta-D-manno-heptose 1,7-bisphosphate 7-phosphatase [Chthonomonadales bacterium]
MTERLGVDGKRRCIFVDRDGVLNQENDAYIKSPDDLILFPNAPASVRRMNEAGFMVIVISNQSGVGRGLFTEQDLTNVQGKLTHAVEVERGKIAALYHCPHTPDAGCDCRKPKPGMILQAAAEHNIDLASSYMVGDRSTDIQCGFNAGVTTVLVLTGKHEWVVMEDEPIDPICTAKDISAAVDWILTRP